MNSPELEIMIDKNIHHCQFIKHDADQKTLRVYSLKDKQEYIVFWAELTKTSKKTLKEYLIRTGRILELMPTDAINNLTASRLIFEYVFSALLLHLTESSIIERKKTENECVFVLELSQQEYVRLITRFSSREQTTRCGTLSTKDQNRIRLGRWGMIREHIQWENPLLGWAIYCELDKEWPQRLENIVQLRI